MVVEVAAAAAVLGVAGTAGLGYRAARRRRHQPEPLETPRSSPAWRLLGSGNELVEAIERAIACERASIALSQQRAQRFAALRTRLSPVALGTLASAEAETPRRPPPTGISRAS